MLRALNRQNAKIWMRTKIPQETHLATLAPSGVFGVVLERL
jgi:hypothetical protein